MKRYIKPLVLIGLLGGTTVATFALADAPAGSQSGTASGQMDRREGMWPSMADRLSRHSQELGLTAQQLDAIKAADQAARPELQQLAQALHQRREALRTQIDGILTPDQRAKLQQLRSNMRGHHGHHGPREAPPAQGSDATK